MNRSALYTFSIGAHVAVAVVLGAIEIHKAHVATAIEIADIKPKEKPAEPPKPPPVTPPKPAVRQPRPSGAPRPVAAAASPAAQANPTFSDLPDFGLALEGGISDGIPVSVAPPQTVMPAASPMPAQVAVKPVPKRACPTSNKPRPISVPQPAYPEAAIASGISGKVRVQLTIDELGQVIDTHLLQRLGREFDEAALAAVRTARFAPATDCGKATRGTFTIALRFSAG
jgi:periplasmic protein TonB